MSMPAAARATLRADGLRLVRDRFLVGTSLYILAISLVMRWAIPWITRGVATRWAFDLQPYHALIVSHVLIQLAALLVGIVGAFLLLEGREERTIQALLVSPFPLTAHLLVSCAVMVVAAALLTLVEAPILGIGLPPWPALVVTAFAGALMAPVFALAVAGLASNKTEAFAYLKIFGTVPLLATGAWFLDEPVQWLAAVYPAYWAVKAYWVAEAGYASWPLWAIGGIVLSTIWVAGALRLFNRAARTPVS